MGFKAWYPAKNSRIASKDISGLPDDLRVVLLRHEAHSCSWKSFSCSQVGTPLASGYSTRCAKVDKGAMFMLGFGVDVVREALSCLYCGKVADQVVFLLILCINPVRKPIEKPERSATTFQTAISEKMLPLRRKWRRLCKSWVLILRTRQIGEWKWGVSLWNVFFQHSNGFKQFGECCERARRFEKNPLQKCNWICFNIWYFSQHWHKNAHIQSTHTCKEMNNLRESCL